MILPLIIQSSLSTVDEPLIQNQELTFSSSDSVTNGFLFFKPYKTSDFPGVVCDKEYFFLYSTEHAASVDGCIVWGKGNNLDMSDFEEVAIIEQGYQAETPWLFYWADAPDSEKLHLFFHTDSSDPGNGGEQQTRLYTSAGGAELHSMTWTDQGRPLGFVGIEDHTGYANIYEQSGTFYAIHLAVGGIPPTFKISTSTNLRSGWSRYLTYDLSANISSEFVLKPTQSHYFEAYGHTWGLITVDASPLINDVHIADKSLILCKVDSDYQVIEQVAVINNEQTRMYHGYTDGNIIHLYFQNPYTEQWHGTFDIQNIPQLTSI